MDKADLEKLAAEIQGPRSPDSEKKKQSVDGNVRVLLSETKMEAYAVVTAAQGEGRPVEVKDLLQALKKEAVVHGVNDFMVKEAVEGASGEKILVAEGTPPTDGSDARIEYLFEDEKVGGPEILEDGSVDLRSVVVLSEVSQGDKLAVKTPATSGSAGVRVTGEKFPSKPGKDKSLLAGTGAELSEDGLTVTAVSAGRPIVVNRMVKVDPIYVVKGNVDYHSGNIDFAGSVIIREWVRDGFSVKAEGDIEVHGGVDAANLEAAGKIIVRYGVQGSGKAVLKAGEDVVASYLVSTEVIAGRDVVVRENIMHCKIMAGRNVIAQGGKGLIVGGSICAGEEVSAKTIGNRLASPTVLEVGENPTIKLERETLENKEKEKKDALDQVKKGAAVLQGMKKMGRNLPLDKEIALKKFLKTQTMIESDLKEIKDRKTGIHEEEDDKGMAAIKAMSQIHPGVKATINGVTLFVRDPLDRVRLTEKNREIVVGVY